MRRWFRVSLEWISHASLVHWVWGLGVGTAVLAALRVVAQWPWSAIAPFGIAAFFLTVAGLQTWGPLAARNQRQQPAEPSTKTDVPKSTQPQTPTRSKKREQSQAKAKVETDTELADRLLKAANWSWDFYRIFLPEKPRSSMIDQFSLSSTHPTVPMKWSAERAAEFVRAGGGVIADLRLECRKLGLKTTIPDPFPISTVAEIAEIAASLEKAAQETSS